MKRQVTHTLLLCLFPCLCLAVALSSCGGPRNQTPEQDFTWPQVGAVGVGQLDPALSATDSGITQASQMLYACLVSLDDNLRVHPQLAQSWQISQDGLHYTFYLRPHLKFSDGMPITASDVAYSLNRALLPQTSSPTANYLTLLKDSDKVLAGKQKTLVGTVLISWGHRRLYSIPPRLQGTSSRG